MIDVFEIGASLHIHGNGLDFMRAFSGALVGAHRQLDTLEKKIGVTKGAMRDLFVGGGQVFAGVEILKGITHLAEAGKELNHQQSMLMRNGLSQRDVMRETADIYKDMIKAVPTASAVDFLRTLGELKTVKGSIAGAREALTQSLKIEGLIGNSTGKSAEGQGYDFWRAVEDKGIIQNKQKTDEFLNAMTQGTIATGGKIGGNDWFTYARRAGSAWMGDALEALPLQLMEMQTLGASGAGVARRAFANRMEGAIKLTKAQMRGWNEIGMLGPNGTIKGSELEHSRPDLFIGEVIEALEARGLNDEGKVKAWAARALHGKDADYFMTAYAGMTEKDPESGLTRLQKERRNLGEAQPLDKAYSTMMGTDFGANMKALEEQWKSFTEAAGGPAAKAMIPVLQGLTKFITDMANFADKNQKLTQIGVDAAAVAGSLLVLGGSLKLIRGSLRLMGGGLFGMGRSAVDAAASALTGSATQLDGSALALKEAAAALSGPSAKRPDAKVPVPVEAPKGPAKEGFFGSGGFGGFFGFSATALVQKYIYDEAKGAIDKLLGWTPANQATLDRATSLPNVLKDFKDEWLGGPSSAFKVPSAYNREMRARLGGDGSDRSLDGIIVGSNDAGKKLGDLGLKTGVVLASFGSLDKGVVGLSAGSGRLIDDLRILEATTLGAARAMAQFAMSGGMRGGSGVVNASWGGGGSAGGLTPLLRGALPHAANPYAGGAGGGSFVPPGAEATTAGMRNNNLGNIGWFGQRMAGLLGPSNARDVDHSIGRFATQEDGIRAAAALALSKFHKGRHTIWDIIAAKGGWTPGALGPGAAANISRMMGVGAHDQVNLDDPGQMERFLHGLAVQEHGPAGRFYTQERIRGALRRSVPAITAPAQKVAPGAPAGGSATSAMNLPDQHIHVYVGNEKVASHVVRKITADARFKRSVGTTDTYGRRAHPGSEVMDA